MYSLHLDHFSPMWIDVEASFVLHRVWVDSIDGFGDFFIGVAEMRVRNDERRFVAAVAYAL